MKRVLLSGFLTPHTDLDDPWETPFRPFGPFSTTSWRLRKPLWRSFWTPWGPLFDLFGPLWDPFFDLFGPFSTTPWEASETLFGPLSGGALCRGVPVFRRGFGHAPLHTRPDRPWTDRPSTPRRFFFLLLSHTHQIDFPSNTFSLEGSFSDFI